jgi:ATP-dependent Clp protease ATP-binding subunit ClpA
MFENYTEKAIKVIFLSNEESRRLGHNFVCTEQLLIGLIGEETGIAAKVLKSMGVTLKDARIEVEKIIGRGSSFLSIEIPFTPGAKRIIELAQEESHQLGHNYIGTEHLLLASLLVDEGNASRVLANLGVEPTKIRPQVLRMLGEITEVSITSKSSTALPRETDITILLESIETKTIAIDRAVNGLKKDIAALHAAIKISADRDWLDVDFQSQPNELSRRDREQTKQGRKVSDFQTIEVNGKLAISVEDLIAAGAIFRE